ncbi:MAG: ABC transporter permease [Rhodanobacteraceae bacterium]|nr:ABC transporter permease [Rhodanobacteraceae bacterium]
MRGAITIFLKDLRETLRNRRNLVRMLLLPVILLPFAGHYFLSFTDKHREDLRKTTLTYAVANEQALPDLVKLYAEDDSFQRVDVPDGKVEDAVRSKKVRFALRIPNDAAAKLKAGEGVSIEFLYFQSDPGEAVVKDRGTAPLLSYSARQRDWRLVFLGFADEGTRAKLLDPVSFTVVNTAPDRERVGYGLGGIIAYAFLLVCFMGCSFTAIDLVAGEKERGTLEILIMLPLPRLQIVLGKYFVIFTVGLVYATLAATSVTAWLLYEGSVASSQVREVITLIKPLEVFLLWSMLIPVTALFAAVVLAISVYARSYREATTLTGFANLLESLLVMVVVIPGISLNWLWAAIPVSNLSLVIRELIRGTLDNYLVVATVFALTLALGAALLLFATAWFRREAIIYSD